MTIPQMLTDNSNLLNKHHSDDGATAAISTTAVRAYRVAHRVQTEMLLHSNVVDTQRVKNMVRLDCEEVLLGELLGSGSFCHVTAVCRVDFKSRPNGGDGVMPPVLIRQRHAIQDGSLKSRYAIKFLRGDLHPDKFRDGAAELVVEMLFLASLDHSNIIKLHGVSSGGTKGFQNGSGFFILIDRLHDTLDQRLATWRELKCNMRRRTEAPSVPVVDASIVASTNQSFLMERLTVAADICSAMEYLHSKNILYRGIDPTNLAFNSVGKIVLFDFGLARELDEAKLTSDGINYELSGNKGSLLYMAPEVGMCQPYGMRADVYGMAILLWQLCTLAPSPFPGLKSRDQYLKRIVHNKERPTMETSWSDTLQYLIQSSWADEPSARPPMKQFHRNLQHEILDIQAGMNQTMRHRHCNPLLSTTLPPLFPVCSNRPPCGVPVRQPPKEDRIHSLRSGGECIASPMVENRNGNGRTNTTVDVNSRHHDIQMATLDVLRKADKICEISNPSPVGRSETPRLHEALEYKRRLANAAFQKIEKQPELSRSPSQSSAPFSSEQAHKIAMKGKWMQRPEEMQNSSMNPTSNHHIISKAVEDTGTIHDGGWRDYPTLTKNAGRHEALEFKRRVVDAAFQKMEKQPELTRTPSQSSTSSSSEQGHIITIKGQRMQRREQFHDSSMSTTGKHHIISKSLEDTGTIHDSEGRDYPTLLKSSGLLGKGHPHFVSSASGPGGQSKIRVFPSNVNESTSTTLPHDGVRGAPTHRSSWSGYERSALLSSQTNRSKSMRNISWKDQLTGNTTTDMITGSASQNPNACECCDSEFQKGRRSGRIISN